MATVAYYQLHLDPKHGPDFIIEADHSIAEVNGEPAVLMPVSALKELYIQAKLGYEKPKNPEHEQEMALTLKLIHTLAANAGLRINEVKIKAEACEHCTRKLPG